MADKEKVILKDAGNGISVIRLGSEDEKFVSLTKNRLLSLKETLLELKNSPPQALIFMPNNADMFCVGADLSLINNITTITEGEEAAKTGQEIFELIERLPCTTIAAISGPCVGGGCELVLACDYRLITDRKSSKIGLPETKLGILPGFGGTQRLPRLIGLPKALDIILNGKLLYPKQALKSGLVDEITPLDKIEDRAIYFAQNKHKTHSLKVKNPKIKFTDKLITFFPPARFIAGNVAKKTVLKKTKGFYPAQPAALECCLYGLSKGKELGIKKEAKELGKLISTSVCKNLVNLFFLTENSKNLGKSAKSEVKDTHGLVIGSGVMGAGIAYSLLKSDCKVTLKDTNQEALNKAKKRLAKNFQKLKYLNDEQREKSLAKLSLTTDNLSTPEEITIVIEAIVENLDIKKKVLGELSKTLKEEAIICSNTSSLPLTKIAEGINKPERVAGMHFFNPVEKMPLVEIIRGEKTDDRTLAIISSLTVKLGKFPIIVNDVPGFLVNRTLVPYLNEAASLLRDGYSISQIDKAASKFGMPMGPIRLLDEVGLDVAVHVGEVMFKGYGERMQGEDYAERLVEKNLLGKKSGAGFYLYTDKKPTPNQRALEVLGLLGNSNDTLPDDIEKRLIFRLLNEAVLCLDEGVAGTPGKDAADQIDLGTVMGIGFPPFRGGLIRYAESLGAKKVLDTLDYLDKKYGARFKPCAGIERRGRDGGSFYG